jgi:hypothetical protein
MVVDFQHHYIQVDLAQKRDLYVLGDRQNPAPRTRTSGNDDALASLRSRSAPQGHAGDYIMAIRDLPLAGRTKDRI